MRPELACQQGMGFAPITSPQAASGSDRGQHIRPREPIGIASLIQTTSQ
jgi:hypothetical protein